MILVHYTTELCELGFQNFNSLLEKKTNNFSDYDSCQGGKTITVRISENFGREKLWQIWQFAMNSPKFYLPIACNI